MNGSAFGQCFKGHRIAGETTLRSFCLKHGFDPGNISRLERGVLAPPQGEAILTKYATALGLEPGSDGWYEFFDLAAAEQGRIPGDLMSDDKVVSKLPVLFRTLRGQQMDDKKLDELVKKIRRT